MTKELNSTYHKVRMIPAVIIQRLRYWYYKTKGYDIDATTQLERNLNLDRINAHGIHIGADTIITSKVTILSHYLRAHVYTDKNGYERTKYTGELCDTYIGKSCVIGIGATIMGGVKIGNHCIIGAGSVVTKDVADNSIVAGSPARVIKENIVFAERRI